MLTERRPRSDTFTIRTVKFLFPAGRFSFSRVTRWPRTVFTRRPSTYADTFTIRPPRGWGMRNVRRGFLQLPRGAPREPPLPPPPAAGASVDSKSFHWIVTASLGDSQFGILCVRGGAAPREVSSYVVVSFGGVLAGMNTSTLPMTGSWLSAGSELRSLWPSRLKSKANSAFTCLLIGHTSGVQTLRPLIFSTSLCPGWSPHSSLYLMITPLWLPGR